MEAITIGARREVFWDEYLIDSEQTTAKLKLHKLHAKEVVLDHNEPWEGDCCIYHCIVKEDGFYRMYYLGVESFDQDREDHKPHPIVVCYAESKDGKNWVKPDLGICEFQGSKSNNIILDDKEAQFDNFSVFKDTNPGCPVDEIYKGVALDIADNYLWCFTSADGIRFQKSWQMSKEGKFDTLNVAYWDKRAETYVCFIRDFHDVPDGDLNAGIRDIRRMTSSDFKNWTTPILLDYGDSEVYPLYTNVIQPYYRADHMLTGFPSRYVEKKEWTPNFDTFAGPASRRKRMEIHRRIGLAITDCLFMSSRDGMNWRRWDEAFMTPGLEYDYNWVYGDCYPALGMIETINDLPDRPNEISMYAFDYHMSMKPAVLRRHTIRIDGFVSYHATYKPCMLVTKPFIFDGGQLSINFATSAAGYMRIKLVGDNIELNSIELFGDNLDKIVIFEEGEAAQLAGKPVRMEITMSDADIYSFKFHS